MRETEKIWMNGELVDWADAKVHVGTHGLHYGSGVFEGIRCYETEKGPAVFRLTDHLERLDDSASLLQMKLPYSVGRDQGRVQRRDRGERASRVLPAADRVLRLRRARRAAERLPGRGRDHELALGRRTSARTRSRTASAPRSRAGSASGRTSSRTSRRRPGVYLNSMLAVMEAPEGRLRRGDPAHGHGLRRGRLRREHLRRQERRHLDAGPLVLDPARHHARHRHPDRAGPRLHGAGDERHPHRPLPRGRDLHVRDGRRGDAGALRGRPRGRRSRPDHARDPGGVPRHGPTGKREQWSHWLEYAPNPSAVPGS